MNQIITDELKLIDAFDSLLSLNSRVTIFQERCKAKGLFLGREAAKRLVCGEMQETVRFIYRD